MALTTPRTSMRRRRAWERRVRNSSSDRRSSGPAGETPRGIAAGQLQRSRQQPIGKGSPAPMRISSGCTVSESRNCFPYQPQTSSQPSMGWPLRISLPCQRPKSMAGSTGTRSSKTARASSRPEWRSRPAGAGGCWRWPWAGPSRGTD